LFVQKEVEDFIISRMIIPDSTAFESKMNYKIWRYLDLARFLDILDSSTLCFSRIDKFEDTYEGYVPVNGNYLSRFSHVLDYVNKFQYANCWHINESESAALWKLYSDSNNSVAIQSTVGRLKNSLGNSPEQICLSEIQYRDYDISFDSMMEATKNPNIILAIIYKRGER